MSTATLAGLARSRTVMACDLLYHARRPLFVVWAAIMALCAWAMSTGSLTIQSGDATVGGTKAYVTSEFSIAMQVAVLTALIHGFFVAVTAGMTVIQDGQWRMEELLHATPLRPREYVCGKFAAVLLGSMIIIAFHVVAMIFFNHVLPNAEAAEIRGPLHLVNYVRPALLFAVPMVVFMAGTSFAIGEWTRRPVLVFLLPVLIFLGDAFFLWEWSPSWLSPALNNILMWIDPAGFRWLNETWLKVDRGVSFYNSAPIAPDLPFLFSRLVFVAAGLGAVALSSRHLAKTVQGVTTTRAARQAARAATEPEAVATNSSRPLPLAALSMTAARPRLFQGAWQVARVELAELRSSPGLYLFVPLILLQILGSSLVKVGFLDTPVLITSGTFAVDTMGPLTVCVSLLLLFYTVESLERERSTRFASIAYATPLTTGSLLLGKGLALSVVALAITAATGLAGVIALLIQHKVGLEARPFLAVWGLLVLPTMLVWIGMVLATHTITQNRYTTYAISLAVLGFTGYRLLTRQINWLGNWPVWSAVRWSDISFLEMDRKALYLSRLFAISLAAFWIALSLRSFRRREWDASRVVHRLSSRPLFRASWRMVPWLVPPLVLGIWLGLEVNRGTEGGEAKKLEKDYWRKNLATYLDAPVPDLKHVVLDLELFPERSGYRVNGTYELINALNQPLDDILLTSGLHWDKLNWTMNDKPCSPENRAGLFKFTPPGGSLAPGSTMRIGFSYESTYPHGISKRGGGSQEFILPSSVVLTSFRGTIAPLVGYSEDVGIDDDNRHDAKEYRDDFYKGQTDSFLGARRPFTTRITVTGPAEFTLNSVGTKTADSVSGGRRTVVWESDQPVKLFNVVAGKWQVERGNGTAVFYDAAHRYNVAEMRDALDAARRYYSEWFYPYPWKELKLSEFAALATYAQGFPTNITFSEGIGFLTKSTPEIHAAFEITAHEAAHQWWGNILTPGKGPGGNILSEGTSHFATILLVEQTQGLNARIDFCKRLEASYGRDRQVDSERPLVKITGEKPGDTTATYDKGGWVFWMLLNQMGRDRALAGIQAFIKAYANNSDHPVLQDFVASMRPFAADAAAFDAFTHQWFFEVVVPEYRLDEYRKTARGENWDASVRIENTGSGTMPVEIAAARGERFAADGSLASDYREARATIVLEKGQSKSVVISCPFEPDRIVVDPDAKVLQLRRKNAIVKF